MSGGKGMPCRGNTQNKGPEEGVCPAEVNRPVGRACRAQDHTAGHHEDSGSCSE